MPSGLGRGVDKAIKDIAEEYGLNDKQEGAKLTIEQQIRIQEFFDRLAAASGVDEKGDAIFTDWALLIEWDAWLYANGLGYAPGPFQEKIARSYQYLQSKSAEEVRQWTQEQIRKYWHIGGPTPEQVLTPDPYNPPYIDPNGTGIWTKSYLESRIRIDTERHAIAPADRETMIRSINYWNMQGESFMMPIDIQKGIDELK